MTRPMRCLLLIAALLVVSCKGDEEVASTDMEYEADPADEMGASFSQKGVGMGSIRTPDDSGETGLVVLEGVHVRAVQTGDFAEVEVEHDFRSDADAVLEGTFRFPLPERAVMVGLSMWVGDREMTGELVEHTKARRIFERIVDAMQDPALVEWEHGNTFKMRVFPIAPREHKRLKIRYLTPLTEGREGLAFEHAISPPAGASLSRARVEWQGKRVLDVSDVRSRQTVRATAAPVASVLSEARADGVYQVLHVRPDWSRIPSDPRPVAKHWLIVVDTSRSALEERKLALESVRMLATGLPHGSDFVVATSDLDTRVDPRGFLPVTQANVASAVRFAADTAHEGATDIEAMIVASGALLKSKKDAAIVYVGDCQPTWGELRPEALAERAHTVLGDVPFHVVLLGAEPGPEATALADGTHGRVLRARNAAHVAAFAGALARGRKEIRELSISAADSTIVVEDGRSSIAYGERLRVALKTSVDKPVPTALRVDGKALGKPVHFEIPLRAVSAPGVVQRFGALWVDHLARTQQPEGDVVAASLSFQVMSKYTSFLVLESEEAYAQNEIARHTPQPSDAPRVTGADLESANADGAAINLDRLQPGDPEIYVHAPRDAQSVEVSFPFGVTKRAHFDAAADDGRGAWMVRFLVPLDTEEGTYTATVRVVQHDGVREALSVSYTVDRTPPELVVAVRRQRSQHGRVAVRVTARGNPAESDLRRVEVQTPDGTIVALQAVRWGEFEGQFAAQSGGGGTMRVVGTDQALNTSVRQVVVP